MKKPDWSKAPEGATHWVYTGAGYAVWLNANTQYFSYDDKIEWRQYIDGCIPH